MWKNAYSGSTNIKIWAAKFTARHPNLVALEISNFKCGHDAPIYTVIEDIIENSGTPYFSFKDLDENKPTGSIKIRVETIDYFLKRYREDLLKKAEAAKQLEQQLAEYERSLRMPLTHKSVERERDVVIPFPKPWTNRKQRRRRETINGDRSECLVWVNWLSAVRELLYAS